MPWEENCNVRSLSPHGLKEAVGHATHVDASAGTEQPRGLLSMTPLGADPSRVGPYMPQPAARGDPKAPNTYGNVPVEKRR